MELNEFPLPQSATVPPDLHALGDYRFQDLCADLWAPESRLATVYGDRGQKQFGIDVIAYDCPVGENGVGQCKCYQEFTVDDLDEAVAEFEKYLDRWRARKVTQFKLFVACPCKTTQVLDKFEAMSERLKKKGITFEFLDRDQLVGKLRRSPPLVSLYLRVEWVPVLCGLPTATSGVGAASARGFVTVFTEWETYRRKDLDDIREAFRCGQVMEAQRRLQEFRKSEAWNELSDELKARALRLLASISLDSGHVAEAGKLAEEARSLDSSAKGNILSALLAYHAKSPTEGLAALGAPYDVDSWNVQLALCLAAGEFTQVLEKVSTPEFPPNAETLRLHAVAMLLMKRVVEAETVISKAVAAQPEWNAMRLWNGVVEYASTICLDFHAWGHLTWPVPSERTLVKTDDASLAKLARCAAAFSRLVDEAPIDAPQRADLETWRLAALANHPDTLIEAERYAAELLGAEPAHFRVVIWALERGFPFDHTRVRAALTALVSNQDVELDAIIALVHLTGLDGDEASAKSVLVEHRARFTGDRAESVWRFLMAQILTRLGDDAGVDALVNEETEVGFQRKTRALVDSLRARRTGETKIALESLIEIYEASQEPEDLLAAAEACVSAGRPEWVVERTAVLLTAFPTSGVLRLALQAALRAEKPEDCLKLLATHRSLFRRTELPADLQRLEIRCLWTVGRRVEALRLTEALAAHTEDPDAALDLLNQQIAFGDPDGCLRAARALLAVEDAPTLPLLQAASMLALTHRDAAVELWERATTREPEDDASIMLAISVAHHLGLEARTGGLIVKMQRSAMRGSEFVKAVPLDEVIEMMQQRREALDDANRQYDSATVPVHVLAVLGNSPLAEIYHALLVRNENAISPLNRAALLVRYGGKRTEQAAQIQPGRLLVDITALLLASHLEILDQVERQFGPLLVSASLLDSLQSQLRQVEPHQPAMDEARSAVLRLVAAGAILVVEKQWPPLARADEAGLRLGPEWCAWMERVRQQDGWLVEHLPLLRHDGQPGPVVLPAADIERVISIGDLLSALRIAGQLDDDDLNQTKELLTSYFEFPPRDVTLQRGQLVFLTGSHAEWLARTPALECLCAFARVEVGALQVEQLQAEVDQANARSELAGWLRTLSERLRLGLKADRYFAIQEPAVGVDEKEHLQHPEVRCLHDLLWKGDQTEGAVWCDDRFLSARHHAPIGPVVGIWEVLGALRKAGTLTEDQYCALLLRLRRANVRYLPLTSDEILHHLRRAPIEDGTLKENSELVVLRQSVAAALLDVTRLLLPTPQHIAQRDLAELQWATSLAGEVVMALVVVWRDRDLVRAQARADWLFEHLHWDFNAICELYPEVLGARDSAQMFVQEIGRLFSAGALLESSPPGAEPAPDSPRRAFFHWLSERLIQPTLTANPDVRTALSDELSAHAEELALSLIKDGVNERVAARAVLAAIRDLPPQRQQIPPPPTLSRVLGLTTGRVLMQAGGHEFVPSDFWRATTAAINGRAEPVAALDGEKITFRPGDAGLFGHAVLLAREGQVQTHTLAGALLPLLLEDGTQRRVFLEGAVGLLDLPAEEQSRAIEDILEASDGEERITRAELYRDRSGEAFYRLLEARLDAREELKPEDFIPTQAAALPLHLRLPTDVSADLNRAAETLLREIGLEAAIFRFSGLPAMLPEPLLVAVHSLESEAFGSLFASLRGNCCTPVSKLQLLRVATVRAVEDASFMAESQKLRDELLAPSSGRQEFSAFVGILRWSFERMRLSAETEAWHPSVFLAVAWAHAARLHNLLLRRGVPRHLIGGNFLRELSHLPRLVRPDRAGVLDDAAFHLHARWSVFICRGLGSILSSVPPEHLTALRVDGSTLKSAFAKEDEQDTALLPLIAETNTRPNALGSFLSGAWEPPLRALLGDPLFEDWLGTTPETLALAQLANLKSDPFSVASWVILWGIVGDAPIFPAARERLLALLMDVDFARLLRREPCKAALGINFACAQARHFCYEKLSSRLEAQLLACAYESNLAHERKVGDLKDETVFNQTAWKLIEAAHWLMSPRAGNPNESAFADLAARLIRACPLLGKALRESLGARVAPLPFSLAGGAWGLYLTIRAAP